MLTWYLASSLLFQREWAMSWMDRRRLWVLPLKCKVLGSSKSCPPICCSSWRTSCSIGIKRRKWSGFIKAAHWSSESSGLCAVDAVTCVKQIKKLHRHHTELCVPVNWNCISWSDCNPLTSFIQQQLSRETQCPLTCPVSRSSILCYSTECEDFACSHCLSREIAQSPLLIKLDMWW